MTRPIVLYACLHNSGRSVAAYYLTGKLAGDRVEARSAGSEPGSHVNPLVAQVLSERGINTAEHVPSLLTHDRVAEADVVITMGCGQACPVFPGRRYEDWQIDDPAGQDLQTVRNIVDEVEGRVRALLSSLGVVVAARPQPGT